MEKILNPTVAEVNLNAFKFNLRTTKKIVGDSEILAIVKANAYGHGILKISETAVDEGIKYLGVATLEEAVKLRENGISVHILILTPLLKEEIETACNYDADLTVASYDNAVDISRIAQKLKKRVKVHIKIDSGLGRYGIDYKDAVKTIEKIALLRNIKLQGVYTHFSESYKIKVGFAKVQIERFLNVVEGLNKINLEIPYKHSANSGAIINFPEPHLNMVRPGIMLYGYLPSRDMNTNTKLKPVMTLKSKVVQVRELEKGSPVSYSRTFITKNKTRIALVPCGYYDGINRLLSNNYNVLINGKKCRGIGTVCMNVTVFDIGLDNIVSTGDEVVFFGSQKENNISIYNICEKLNTIPYEVLCWISPLIPRVYTDE
ncbi:alanine racemase [candidate division KSB1 bacterium]|nr:MAG: alanine racemase [candidate division KSB1 bacterium]